MELLGPASEPARTHGVWSRTVGLADQLDVPAVLSNAARYADGSGTISRARAQRALNHLT